MQNASSADRACMANLSASLNTVTVGMPSLRAVVITRQAISPRLAIKSLLMGTGPCEACSSSDAAPAVGPSRNDTAVWKSLVCCNTRDLQLRSVPTPQNAQVPETDLCLPGPLKSKPVTIVRYDDISYYSLCRSSSDMQIDHCQVSDILPYCLVSGWTSECSIQAGDRLAGCMRDC